MFYNRLRLREGGRQEEEEEENAQSGQRKLCTGHSNAILTLIHALLPAALLKSLLASLSPYMDIRVLTAPLYLGTHCPSLSWHSLPLSISAQARLDAKMAANGESKYDPLES